MSSWERASAGAGLCVVVLGIVLLLDQLGTIHLDLGALTPITLAVSGAISLLVGLARGGLD